jgi:oxaloacetate decarboxylase beta subunit
MGKLMNLLSSKNPLNPLIGASGVSAVPMAARVAQVEGQKSDPSNYLLMHAMGPNVAGVIGTTRSEEHTSELQSLTTIVAGYFITRLG